MKTISKARFCALLSVFLFYLEEMAIPWLFVYALDYSFSVEDGRGSGTSVYTDDFLGNVASEP